MHDDLASTIARIDDELEENGEARRLVWSTMYTHDEYGERILTAPGKRRMRILVAERKRLEESANAAYRIRST